MKYFRESLIILLLSAVLGFVLLLASCLIPVRPMIVNCRKSVATFEKEGLYYSEPYSGRRLDKWSDSVMLMEAAYETEEGTINKTVNSYFFKVKGRNLVESLVLYYSGAEKEREPFSYGWYWHGYLVTLRPLLANFSYDGIRTINASAQIVLLMIVLFLMTKKYPSYLIPFLLCLLLMGPTAIAKSLHFSSVYYVVLIVLIFMLGNPGGIISRKNVWRLFLLSGIATGYLDLLSTPTLSLTIPLCLLCIQINREQNWKENMKVLCLCSFSWFFGYAGMWGMKWIITLALQGSEFFDALKAQILLRISTKDKSNEVSRITVLRNNWRTLNLNVTLKHIITAYSVVLFVAVLWGWRSITRQKMADTLAYAVPALIAVCWILLLCNHSSVHEWFTFRTLAPVVFCFLSALTSLTATPQK